MFSSNFAPDMTAWLPDAINVLNDDPQTHQQTSPRRDRTKHQPSNKSPRNKRRTPKCNKIVKQPSIQDVNPHHRSHSPVGSPNKPNRKVLIRSLSADSPRSINNKNGSISLITTTNTPRTKKLPPPSSSPRAKKPSSPRAIKPSSPRTNKPSSSSSPRTTQKPSPRERCRPAPLLVKATSTFNLIRLIHLSEDPQPSPKVNKLSHLSEEAPMSPKVMIPSPQRTHRKPSLLGRMIRIRKQNGNRVNDDDMKLKNHIAHQHQRLEPQTPEQSIPPPPPTAAPATTLLTDDVDLNWDFTSRPDVDHTLLKSGSMLDKRHTSRSVRCVIWKPKKSKSPNGNATQEKEEEVGEKFAMKMIMRTTKLKHVFNEKDIMLSLDSRWHTKLFKTFKTDNNLYMLMEYAEKGSLHQQISWGRGLKQGTPQLITFYAACVIKAIQYMHKKHVVHRDIKPDNLLIGSDGYLKVCDYGLSKFLPQGERTNTFLGTLAYMPPEQMNGSSYNHSVDYWGLGVSVYEMAFGVTPFEPLQEMLSEKEWQSTLKKNVEKAVIRFPSKSIGLPLKLFMKSMLVPNVEARLGGDLDIDRIENHSCFAKFDWNALHHRTMEPPSNSSYSFTPAGTVL